MDERERVAIVTGASSGIGREVVAGFARRGTRTIAVARREDRLEETAALARAAGAECLPLVGDVGDPESARRAVALARERFGRLDVLVNNAGVSKRKHLLEVTREDAEATVRTNLLGPIYFVLEALPPMIELRAGTIVNVSSIAGRLGNPREAIYSATKFGLVGLCEVMFHDLHRRGIHTVLVLPGPIDTEIWRKVESPPAYRGKLHPPRLVAEAIFDAIERRRHVVTVPRTLGAVALLKALFPALVRRGADAFDPDRG